TLPCLSPTTTRALKLKRRPPLTTAAQRRIFTTRSSKPSCRDSRSLAMNNPRSLRRAGRVIAPVGVQSRLQFQPGALLPPPATLELESPFAGGVGEGLDPAVVAVVAAVEGGLGDALAFG